MTVMLQINSLRCLPSILEIGQHL